MSSCNARTPCLYCFSNTCGKGFTMFSIADLLDRARASGSIVSDYQLAKVIGISHQAMTHYRMGRTLPNESVIEQLCALSGDDPGVIAAQIQSARSKTPEAKNMWLMIAKRLAGGASTAILSVLVTISLIAGYAPSARASERFDAQTGKLNGLYIVSITFLSVGDFLRVRLRSLCALFWCLSRVHP